MISDLLGGSQRCWLSQRLHRVERIDRQIEELNQLAAAQMRRHQNAVTQLVEIPGMGAEEAQEILSESRPAAAAFPSAAQWASWIGVHPGLSESAGKNHSGRSAGFRAACYAKPPRSHLPSIFKRLVVRLRYVTAVWPSLTESARSFEKFCTKAQVSSNSPATA